MSTHVCPPRAPHVQGAIREDATLANITWLHHWGLTEDYPSSGWRKAHRVGKVCEHRSCLGRGTGRGGNPDWDDLHHRTMLVVCQAAQHHGLHAVSAA